MASVNYQKPGVYSHPERRSNSPAFIKKLAANRLARERRTGGTEAPRSEFKSTPNKNSAIETGSTPY